MALIGYHASHEQFPPSELLRLVQRAEGAGFQAALNSDHFHPWTDAQGHSGFAWSFMGAALAATKLSFGVVNAPGQRYHPVIIAQAIATLSAMYEGRFWVALGSGEASNEHVTGQRWPRKDLRNQRLRECVDIIRALLRGEEVSHDGLVRVDRATVYSRPAEPPPLFGAAVSEATAAWCAEWADGLITVNAPVETLRRMVAAYRDAGGRGDLALQVHLSWAPDQREAEALAYEQWRSNVFPPPVCWDVDLAATFDAISEDVPMEKVTQVVNVSADLGAHTARLAEYAELGFGKIFLHHVGQEQEAFVAAFGEKVLPQLRSAA